MSCSCDRPITVRPQCGGRRVCLSPWLALVLGLLFLVLLFTRCHCAATAVTDVSRETSVSEPTEMVNACFT
ncbi:MAG: hypothetical protein IJD01_07350 [Clostridia bacterium]|nr:hypothetical protein [Clostridia bacterium]